MTMKRMNLKLSKWHLVITMFLCVCAFACCNDEQRDMNELEDGFYLNEVKIDDKTIDALTSDVINRQKNNGVDFKEEVTVMNILPQTVMIPDNKNGKSRKIAYSNDTIYISYGIYDKKSLSDVFIFKSNVKQIIGYVTYHGIDVILFTNINEENTFNYIFDGMFHNTDKNKYFDYIRYPKDGQPFVLDDHVFFCFKMAGSELADSIFARSIYGWDVFEDSSSISGLFFSSPKHLKKPRPNDE